MINNLISIIVPIYNVKDYLTKCIESIMAQTYTNIEIILVDDGSKDGSSDICDFYAKKDSRIIVVHQNNNGLTMARKSGLQASHGMYIGFVDGDDWVEPMMYEELFDVAQNENAELIMSGMYRDQEGNIYAEWKATRDYEAGVYEGIKLYELKQHLFDGGINGSCCNKLFRRNLLYNNLMRISNELAGVEDDLFSFFCILEASKVVIIDKSFYHGVERATSATHSLHKNWYYQMHYAIQHYDHMMQVFPDQYFINQCQKAIAWKIMLGISHVCDKVFLPFRCGSDYFSRFRGKRILLYGGGEIGENYYYYLSRFVNCKIVAWADSNIKRSKWTNNELISLNRVREFDFDYVLIAVARESIFNSIKESLQSNGIPKEKIFWEVPSSIIMNVEARDD